MGTTYKRIPLTIEALFLPDGSFRPQKLIYNSTTYHITRVVRCIAPIEYTVIIDGIEKQIYYEEDTNTWFSVKEVYCD